MAYFLSGVWLSHYLEKTVTTKTLKITLQKEVTQLPWYSELYTCLNLLSGSPKKSCLPSDEDIKPENIEKLRIEKLRISIIMHCVCCVCKNVACMGPILQCLFIGLSRNSQGLPILKHPPSSSQVFCTSHYGNLMNPNTSHLLIAHGRPIQVEKSSTFVIDLTSLKHSNDIKKICMDNGSTAAHTQKSFADHSTSLMM